MLNNKNIIEALLFSSTSPLKTNTIKNILNDDEISINKLIDELNNEYNINNKPIFIDRIGGGYQIFTKSEYHVYINKIFINNKKMLLSKKSLETLSIIAYKQPIPRSEIEYIRGVNSDGIIKSLLEKELITIKGRDSGIGRALLYGTTQLFLESFGLFTLSDLPTLKEIDEINLGSTSLPTKNNETK